MQSCRDTIRAFPLHALLLFALFAATPAFAQRIECVTEEFPPLQQKIGDKICGFSTEVVTAALERAGLEYTVGIYPWARAYAMARDAPNVLIFSLLRSPERENLFKWAGELVTVTSSLYRLTRRKDVNPATLEEARNFKIVVLRDDAAHRFLASQGFREGENLLVVSNPAEQFRALTTFQETTLLPLANQTMAASARAAGLDPAALTEAIVLPMPAISLQAAFSASTPDAVTARFASALENLKREGFVDQAKTRWGLP